MNPIINSTARFLSQLPGGDIFENPYLLSLVLLLLFVVLGKVVVFIFSKYLEKIAAKTKTKIDDLIFERTKTPLFYFMVILGVELAVQNLGYDGVIDKILKSILAIIFLFMFLRVFNVIIETWGTTVAKRTKTNIDEVLLPLFQKVGKVIFFLIAFMWVLDIWKIDITPYLAGVGISGLILGMALQDSLKNVFGGISLLLDKSFKVGDPVRLESGELGKIQDIGLRSTKMLTFDNEVIFIPNGQLANMKIHNYVKPNTKVRRLVDFSVAYGTDVEKARKVALEAMKRVQDIYDDPYIDVIFTKMGDSGLHLQARFFADWDLAYNKWLEITEAIHSALVKNKIEIPFPTRTVHLRK